MGAERCHNIFELQAAARRRLPAPMYHFLEGGAEDERTLAENVRAWSDYDFIPTALTDVSTIDMRTSILGMEHPLPLILSPTGASELFHHQAERAVARAAARAGLLYGVSCMATTSLEDVRAASDGPLFFQILPFKDRGLLDELLGRARAAGMKILCLTIDSTIPANRERDRRTGLTVPPRLTGRSIMSLFTHPSWSIPALFQSSFRMANFETKAGETSASPHERIIRLFDRTVTWKDAEWLRSQWDGPVIVKGVNAIEDARQAVSIGANAAMISNHGGRQLDDTVAPIRQLPRIRDAIGDGLELIVDGGIRRGRDIAKALALGATACSVGRAYLYGLAAFGEPGVDRALSILRTELERTMALLGTPTIASIKPEHVARRDATI